MANVADVGQAPATNSTSIRRIITRVRKSDLLMSVVSVVIIVVGWALVAHLSSFPRYILPTPMDVVRQASEHHEALLEGTIATGREVIIGFVAACVIAVPLSIAVAFSRTIDRLVYPITVSAQSVPKVAVAPIFLVWFGFGEVPKIVIAALMAFFPILVDTVLGLRRIDPELISMAKVSGAGPMRVFFKLRIRTALPNFFTGLKVGITLAVTGAIVGEFVAGTSGLGYVIQSAQGLQLTALAFAAIIILAILALLFFYLVELIERITLKGPRHH